LASGLEGALGILTRAEPQITLWIADDRLLAGRFPEGAFEFDFTSEAFAPIGSLALPPVAPRSLDRVIGRKTSDLTLRLLGRETRYESWKALLIGGLRQIEEARPGALDALAAYHPRSKRAVARRPDLLYENRKQVEQFSAQLMPGWFVATNNSRDEVLKYIRKAGEGVGLVWGKDLDVVDAS
jgi:phosphoglycolate phosphatase-like HAD superfamily hydrolase